MPYGTFPPSERCVRLSPHTAQASQRPCEGPVSSYTTCWLLDTEHQSIPLRGREHQCKEATVICNTFFVDSYVVLVPRHQMEVSPLSWGMKSSLSASLQSSLRLLHPRVPALPSASLTVRLPFGRTTGLPRFVCVPARGRSGFSAGDAASATGDA